MDFFLPQTLFPGYRFFPTDQELVQFYLYPKVTNPLFIASAPVSDCDIYAYQPLQIWNAFNRIQGEDVFFFTNLKKKSPTSHVTRKIAGGPATWHREDTDRAIGVAIDEHCSVTAIRKCFSYQSTQPGQHGCGWTMYEYSLPSLSQVIVLCQLRRKGDNKSHTQTTKKRRRQADGVDDATNTISQKARVDDEGYHQQQITGFEAAAETESEIVYNGVRSDNSESFSHHLFKDLDNDQMAVTSSGASTINVAAPTVSTSSCAENLQPNKVVCIDNDEEPSATEEDDDYHQELLRLLGLDGGSDLAGGVPSIQTPPEAAEVHSTPKGSTPVESLATDADGYHLDAQVSGSSLSSGGSFSQQVPQANPTCLVQENEVEMIYNPFRMENPYGVSLL
ncbi:hypothetical protein POTOM_018909 [Populus tomentosa]|uniref:NAC domain-containing protein n=1 Tax=Populus tomentosa TaxID=118781 RepID=A0A8X7ZUS5_POPTO|nr:hypothetical protein POTOM_018909 [Populus tomentosa]